VADSANDERSLPPTARRLEDARRAGEIPISQELVAAGSLAAGWAVLVLGSAATVGGLVAYLHVAATQATAGASVARALRDGLWALVGALVWPLLAIFTATLLGGLLQTRARLSPIFRPAGAPRRRPSIMRLLERERVAETAFDVLQLGVVAAVAAASVPTVVRACAALPRADLAGTLHGFAGVLRHLGTRLVGVIVVLAAVDYGRRVLRHRQRLQMSHHDVRRDEREREGAPERKAERRRMHRELLAAPPGADVGKADLLVLEPGVVAVAVCWRQGAGSAPLVLMRAAGPWLPRLDWAARQAGVPMCIDPPLARALAWVADGD
jgi:flagellar biosynthesis protein FlhB